MSFLASSAQDIIGSTIAPPISGLPSGGAEGFVKILNVLLNVVLIVAGLYTLFNLILAGYAYITSEGDAKKVQTANAKITYTVIGLVMIVLAPLAAALIGYVVFGDWQAIINPNWKSV